MHLWEMNNKSCVHSAPSSSISVRVSWSWCSSIQLPWLLLASCTGARKRVPSFLGSLPPKPSVFVTVFAVWVAVGKAWIARPQRLQELCQLCQRLIDTLVISKAIRAVLQEAVYFLLYRLQEFPLQELRQKLLTHHDKALLLSDGVTGHKCRLAVHSQAAKYIFVLLLAVDQLAPC